MDRAHKKRMETVRLIITETIMVVAVVFTVILLTFIAMGYNLNKDGELGQSGLVQIRSLPTGATIAIDGDTILAKTNTSRLLSAGEHTIKLTRDGYDSWEKTITSEPGRLLKMEYARLFYQDRTPEQVAEMGGEVEFFVSAPNRDFVIVVLKNNNKWIYYDLRGDGTEKTELDLTEIMKDLTPIEIAWDQNSDKVLVKTLHKNETEWLVINVKNVTNSVNLTKEFAMNFTDVQFATDNGDKLYALENGNLRAIATNEKTVSQVMASDVKKYAFANSDLLYLTNARKLALYQTDSDDIEVAQFGEADGLINIEMSEYIGQKYLTMTVGKTMKVYRGGYPTENDKLSEMELILDKEIGFEPATLKERTEGELLVAKDDKKIAVFNAENSILYSYELENSNMFMVDDYLFGTIVDGKLFVRDFDGTNKREITSASSNAFITKNGKWLYYLNTKDGKTALIREKIIN